MVEDATDCYGGTATDKHKRGETRRQVNTETPAVSQPL